MPKSRVGLRDWLFSGRGKRRLLETLLLTTEPEGGWSESQLAKRAGMRREGSVDAPLAALGQLGVVQRTKVRYTVRLENPLVDPLRLLLHALRAVEDTEILRPSAWKKSRD